jgi:hypothetical protein
MLGMKQYVPLLIGLAINGLVAFGCWYFYILHAERSIRKTGVPAMDKEKADKLRRTGKMALFACAAGAVFLIYQAFTAQR